MHDILQSITATLALYCAHSVHEQNLDGSIPPSPERADVGGYDFTERERNSE